MEYSGQIAAPSKYCLGCWYALDGLSEPRCPECGRRFDPADDESYSAYPNPRHLRSFGKLLLLMLGLMAIEIPCVWITYEAVSGLSAAFLSIILIPLANLVALFTFILRRPRLTAKALIAVAAVFFLIQSWQGVLLIQTRYEANKIIAYLNDHFAKTEEYPTNFTNYQFVFSTNVQRFQLERGCPADGGYRLVWYVATPSTSHWHTPVGGFGYYPD